MDAVDLPVLPAIASPPEALAAMRQRRRSAVLVDGGESFGVLDLEETLRGIRGGVSRIGMLDVARDVLVVHPRAILDAAANLLRPALSKTAFETILADAGARFGLLSILPRSDVAFLLTRSEKDSLSRGAAPTTCWCSRRDDHVFGRDEVSPGQSCPDCVVEIGTISCDDAGCG
ncbi:hypothetical protein [Marinimicrococcus flavescens]|uniref:CBS domain-containing protein n=1 Tax=Marinimicrococcus flavescens TaxID=3031815 RepID=A0AAP3UYW9_9PROT|nr:hypothetical protein [Marinimicrococcus flavescens]